MLIASKAKEKSYDVGVVENRIFDVAPEATKDPVG